MLRFHRLLGGLALVIGLLTICAPTVAAASPKRTWQATIGSSRVLATAALTLYPGYTGTARVSVSGLSPQTTYASMIYKGTCANPTPVVRLPGVRTDDQGNGVRESQLGYNDGVSLWNTGGFANVAIRISSGARAYCARLTYPVATRIEIARYGIDLPVVHQPAGQYPYCNVAMYAASLSQPGEAGPTFIYAHARVGMFLPLLKASQTNAAAMVGTTVRVWSSDSRVWTYRISRVLRFQYTTPAYDPNAETLWLQTSEGPHGTMHKLFMVATRVSVDVDTWAAAHPTPNIVVCS